MKSIFKPLFIALVFFFSHFLTAQDNIEHLICSDYWSIVDFDAFALSPSHFNFEGANDICKANSNDSYPYDELIYITIYNAFDEEGAKVDFEDEKEYNASVDGFMEVPNLGDDAFAVLRIDFGELNSVIINIVKGMYTIYIEVNGKATIPSNNLFSPSTVFDFARTVVEKL